MQHLFTKFNLCYKTDDINEKRHPLYTYSTATKFTMHTKRKQRQRVHNTWSLLR